MALLQIEWNTLCPWFTNACQGLNPHVFFDSKPDINAGLIILFS
jgi:hypothetical protein